MQSHAILCVANLSAVANAQYLERVFSAYGEVQKVEMFGEGHERFAEVTFPAVDDADTAIAALHYRYYTTRNLPLIVLYSKRSPSVSTYGHQVGQEFRRAAEENRMPAPILLESFDPNFPRSGVQAPPTEREFLPENRSQQVQLQGSYY